ncbi:MAG: UTP-glucose-1-phosphate uridylyltransferase [Polaribacter sp.]|jgi:UTP-glucose-1-phosphate uridylyltransferase
MFLENVSAGAGNEIQLTDATRGLIHSEKVSAIRLKGATHDCGCKLGYYQTFVKKALEQGKLELRDFKSSLITLVTQMLADDESASTPKIVETSTIVRLFG